MNDWFKKLNCCLIITTRNNGSYLLKLIKEVQQYTSDLIVVYDGTIDHTAAMESPEDGQVKVIHHVKYADKGTGLRAGFALALEKGYDHAITLENDARFSSADLPLFLSELENHPNSLVIGSPGISQENVPAKSSAGSKFSNFLFWVKTGIRLKDTKSCYRLYPIRKMEGTRYFSSLSELETEVIVKAAWQGIVVKNIPLQLYNAAAKQPVSSFRRFRDFSRICILNTYLLTLALFYYIPKRFLGALTKENIRNFIKKNFFDEHEPIHIKALSIAFGVFMGILPIMGFQLLLGIPLAHFFRLNKAIFVTAAHISIPPMIPPLIFASYKLGGLLVENPTNNMLFGQGITMKAIEENFVQYVLGAVALSVILALFFGIISYLYFYIARNRRLALKSAPVNNS